MRQALTKFELLTESDCTLVEKEFKYKKVLTNEIILKEGEICQSAYFILSGSFIQYQLYEIDEQVIDLHLQNEWFLNHSSFINQKPSLTTIKSYENSEVLELSVHSIHKLIKISPKFFTLGQILEQARERTHFFDNSLTPTEKYNFIMENKPMIIQKFPLKTISSYLKIAPETLSRVRAKIS